MAEAPRGQTWLVSAASMMLVDGWSVVGTREKRQAFTCFGQCYFVYPRFPAQQPLCQAQD
jgi:hypothetical protein